MLELFICNKEVATGCYQFIRCEAPEMAPIFGKTSLQSPLFGFSSVKCEKMTHLSTILGCSFLGIATIPKTIWVTLYYAVTVAEAFW